jgi:hypothetical protein
VLAIGNEDTARAWCESWARRSRIERIKRNGAPYLERYFVAGWNPITRQKGPAIFLHHFVASDAAGEIHSHPWGWSMSVILVGGYREERCSDGQTVCKDYRPGDVNVISANDRHRIDLLGRDCWTLFMAGSFDAPWQFYQSCHETRFVPYG